MTDYREIVESLKESQQDPTLQRSLGLEFF